jgi:hypothetical protein
VDAGETSPRGSGRPRVRIMTASMVRSTRQLIAAAAPATSAMPTVAANTIPAGGNPGVARNMPITAQNTISDTTRGFARARNCRRRFSARASAVMAGGRSGNPAFYTAVAITRSATP